MHPVAMNAQRGWRESPHHKARLRIGQNCRAVCTRRVVLRAIATARDVHALSNNRHESAARFKRPAKQALVLATEP